MTGPMSEAINEERNSSMFFSVGWLMDVLGNTASIISRGTEKGGVMKESDEYRLGRSAALRGEPMAKYQSLTARMNPKKRAAFVQGYYDGLRRKDK